MPSKSELRLIEPSALKTDGLAELASTPILLFMIAYTWGDLNALYANWHPPAMDGDERDDEQLSQYEGMGQEEAAWDRKHRIYEAFFRAIAWGKYERDRDAHPLILKAAHALREALEAHSLLTSDETIASQGQAPPATYERDRLTQAMLWLMGRVAWHSRCLQQQPKPKQLTRSHVDRILDEELELDDPKVTDVARDGLLLAMQADLSESSRPILFGHQSFREFLVARCWAELLRVIVEPQTSAKQKAGLIKILRAGRLRDEDDRSFAFLRARLRQWARTEQLHLYRWALEEFENDGIEMQPPTLRGDSRRDFRAMSLALASVVAPREGLALRDASHLRSLLASYWIAHDSARIWASRLQAKATALDGADLSGAFLSEVNLSQAALSGATMSRAFLSRADLSKAVLTETDLSQSFLDLADLSGANFSGANLSNSFLFGANILGARLSRANLRNSFLKCANLSGAHLDLADLSGANLTEANLTEADLTGANLSGAEIELANLSGAHLSGAHLSGAYLVRANLSGAHLDLANLSGANLSGANLSGADLLGANLSGANLSGVNLSGANLSGANLARAVLDEEGYVLARSQGAVMDELTRFVPRLSHAERLPEEDIGVIEENSAQTDDKT